MCGFVTLPRKAQMITTTPPTSFRGLSHTIAAYNFFPENLDEGQMNTAFQENG